MRTHIRPFTHVCMYMHPCTRRKSVQRYNFFLIYANFSKEKCKKSSFFCNLSCLGGKTASKIAFQFASFEKLLYLRHAPFPYRGGFPPKIRSRPAEYMQAARFFAYRSFRRL